MRTPDLVELKIEPSRASYTLGTRFGLLGQIHNVSTVPLRFYERETVFVAPPETRLYGSGDSREGCAFFATEGNPAKIAGNGDGAARDPRGNSIVLQPGDSYWVFWDFDTNGCVGWPYPTRRDLPSQTFWQWLGAWRVHATQSMMFQPGPYKMVLQTKFYTEDPGQTTKYHTAAEMKEVVLSAAQSMILLGAVLGGILAFVIRQTMMPPPGGGDVVARPVNPPEGQDPPPFTALSPGLPSRLWNWLGILVKAVGAGLLSLTVVILTSRLGDSQFPLKVTINDFWGAIALGFFGNLVGLRWITRLATNLGPQPDNSVAPPTPSPAPQGDRGVAAVAAVGQAAAAEGRAAGV